ncbi:hypothetical protein [Butyrivibrio sp. LC3010]|uniref:hypothetical protein n=1 Tax=Butyrivibrio sp. LC3010 TaxID=1280680 RepID=UPI000422171B|nr:hypothetical protein [Butyrivibrio sp. LC3010]
MASYRFNDLGGVEIDFDGIKPSVEIRNKMKAVKYRWNPQKMIWWAHKNDETVAVAKEICGDGHEANVVTVESTAQATKAVKKYVRSLMKRKI